MLQRDGSCWMCQLKHLSRPDVTKSAISSKVYVKAQNKRNPSSVVVSFLRLKMANLSDLMSFALTVASRYEETRVESSFRPLQRQADFYQEIRIAWLPNRTPDKPKGCFSSWLSIEDPFKIQALTAKQLSRNAAFEATSIRRRDIVYQGATVTLFAPY